MPFLKIKPRSPGDNKIVEKEIVLDEIKLHKYKFSKKPYPSDKSQILIITNFSEFGCESLALMYCIPKILQMYPNSYVVCVGWYGREYLYRHLADEYWELPEDCQWLREYSHAFHHTSKNLAKLEKSLLSHGVVYKSENMGYLCVARVCNDCKHYWGEEDDLPHCAKCNSISISDGFLFNIPFFKKFAIKVPRPSRDHIKLAQKYLKPNSVGIFARSRKAYGRNLRPEFYVSLIKFLEDKGYNPIWIGEKQSVMPCPVSHITDFSRMAESKDLELTLAIISQLEFTIQFWTASTRLASMVDTPWILFESPDQIVGRGQEGRRIALTTDSDKRKLVLSNFHTVVENEDKALEIVDKSIEEMKQKNWDDVIGLVDNIDVVKIMLEKQKMWR